MDRIQADNQSAKDEVKEVLQTLDEVTMNYDQKSHEVDAKHAENEAYKDDELNKKTKGFGGGNDTVRHLKSTTLRVLMDERSSIQMKVVIVPEIASPIRTHSKEITKLPYLRGLKLAHAFPAHYGFRVNLLIGADYYWEFMEDKIIRGDGPTAVESKIGYLLSGPTKKSTNEGGSSMLNILISHKEEEDDLETFWKIESLGVTPQTKENTQKEPLENG